MDPEHWLLFKGIQGLIEILVVFVFQFRGGLGPDGVDTVDNIVFVCFGLLAVFPFGLFAENHSHRHEFTVLAQKLGDAALGSEFLAVGIEIKGDYGSPVRLLAVFHRILGRSVAGPLDRLRSLFPRKGFDGDFFRNHKSGIETKSEMAYDALVLVFLQEFAG